MVAHESNVIILSTGTARRSYPFFILTMERLSRNDLDTISFQKQNGFFSIEAYEAFERHLKRLYLSSQNRHKDMQVINYSNYEPLWY